MTEYYVLNPNKLLVFIIFILLWVLVGYMLQDLRPQLELEFARKVRRYAPPPRIYYIMQNGPKPLKHIEKEPSKPTESTKVKINDNKRKEKVEELPERKISPDEEKPKVEVEESSSS